MASQLELLVDHPKPGAKVSVILLDWSVRESFHSLHYLNRQSVDRDEYELIWIEFYDRKPQALLEAAESAGRPLVDKLVVMNYPRDVIFHKHRMYNLGIVLADGDICVICDSDAMFTPNFIQSIITAFEQDPQSAVHLDEVRSMSRKFYPFNYPSFEEFLATRCPNWTGRTTKGLDRSGDMLHAANYGACLAAWREDLIRIGGADEHLDYLGYICGPYDLTFRLVNAGCRERWLTDEYLYHSWHPGESGINIDYHGPSDGRGMSSRALAARTSGAIQPGLENGAIRALRTALEAQKQLSCGRPEMLRLPSPPSPLTPLPQGERGTGCWSAIDSGRSNVSSMPVQRFDRQSALELLESPQDDQWREAVRAAADGEAPRLVKKAFHGTFDVYSFRGCFYGIPTCDETFDPVQAKAGFYELCLRTQTRPELERWLQRLAWRKRARKLVKAGVRWSKKLATAGLHAVGIRVKPAA